MKAPLSWCTELAYKRLSTRFESESEVFDKPYFWESILIQNKRNVLEVFFTTAIPIGPFYDRIWKRKAVSGL